MDGREVGQHVRRFTRGGTTGNTIFLCLPISRELLKTVLLSCICLYLKGFSLYKSIYSSVPKGLRDFAHILSYIPSETIESVISACKIAIQSETISKDVRKRRNKKQQNPHPKFILVLNTPRSRYNQLLRAEL
jgi:hypothetical protein